jgi:transcriptional regulator with XRE-family HTH domain
MPFSWVFELAPVKNPAGLQAFGTHVRRLREARAFSQQALADHADIAKATVQRIENAQYSVTLDILFSLARALQLPLREMMDFSWAESIDEDKTTRT